MGGGRGEARAYLMAILPDLGAPLVGARRRRPEGRGSSGIGSKAAGCCAPWSRTRRCPPCGPSSVPSPWGPGVLDAVASAFRELGRIGDPAVARVLLDRSRPSGVRVDAVLAQRDEPWEVARPLLTEALGDADDAVASQAAQTLEDRAEPEARRILADGLFDARWRAFERQGALARGRARGRARVGRAREGRAGGIGRPGAPR